MDDGGSRRDTVENEGQETEREEAAGRREQRKPSAGMERGGEMVEGEGGRKTEVEEEEEGERVDSEGRRIEGEGRWRRRGWRREEGEMKEED